jgi:hypothetical protein
MTIAKSIYSKLAAIGVVLTLLAAQMTTTASVSFQGAGDKSPFIPPDLISVDSIGVFDAFSKSHADFTKLKLVNGNLSTAEKERIEAAASRLRQLTTDFERSLREFTGKFKAAGKWTPEFDAFIEQRIAGLNLSPSDKAALTRFAEQNGGARAVIEKAPANLGRFVQSLQGDANQLTRSRNAALDCVTALTATYAKAVALVVTKKKNVLAIVICSG